MARRKSPEINAGSMADIAFLLLIFFLVTTTMDDDKGLLRILPEIPEEIQEQIPIKKRNVFEVLVNLNDQLLVEGDYIQVTQLREKAKEFILNESDRVDLPEKKRITAALCQQKIAEFAGNDIKLKKWRGLYEAHKIMGDFWDSKQVVSLQNDHGTSYEMYIKIQNELVGAYSDLRNELALSKFNKSMDELELLSKHSDEAKAKIKAIKKVFPQKISEAEPKKIG